MGDTQKSIFEPNGLLDFFPTPPQSLEEDTEPPTKPAPAIEQIPSQYQYDDDEPPPPDLDEEPSDFEDEVHGIMEREKSSSSRGGMDIDDDEEAMPIASCESNALDTSDHSLTSEVTCILYSTT
jgi:hypothetical protein